MLMSLVPFQQGTAKKSKKLIKAVNIAEENIHISWTDSRISMKVSGKNVSYDSFKGHKKQVFYPFSGRHIFGKTTRGSNFLQAF